MVLLVLLGVAALVWAALSGETTVTAQPVRPSEPGVPARQPAPPEEGAAWATLVVTVRATDGSVPRGTQVGYVRGAEATLLPVDEKGRHTFSHVPPGSVEVFARGGAAHSPRHPGADTPGLEDTPAKAWHSFPVRRDRLSSTVQWRRPDCHGAARAPQTASAARKI